MGVCFGRPATAICTPPEPDSGQIWETPKPTNVCLCLGLGGWSEKTTPNAEVQPTPHAYVRGGSGTARTRKTMRGCLALRPRLRFQLHRFLCRSLSGFCPNRLLASRRPARRRSRTQLLLHVPTHRSLWRSSARIGEFSCRWTSHNSGVVLQEGRLGFMSIRRRVPVHQLFQRRWRPGVVLLRRIVQPRRRCATASGCSTTLFCTTHSCMPAITIIMSTIIHM